MDDSFAAVESLGSFSRKIAVDMLSGFYLSVF